MLMAFTKSLVVKPHFWFAHRSFNFFDFLSISYSFVLIRLLQISAIRSKYWTILDAFIFRSRLHVIHLDGLFKTAKRYIDEID